ncbi:MAG: MBOAT family protein [Ruminococcus sp.]|nr:MBOAT family protein [Ruminococcus sp.]
MLFSGIPFLFYFLPAVVILYYIVPKMLKNTLLLLASLIFYAWGEPVYVIFMVIGILIGYISGLLIHKFRDNKKLAVTFLSLSAVVSLGMLGYFKYADFFISNFNAVTGLSVPLLRIALPVGISFYTFQTLSYTIDVFRGAVPPQKNLINLACYVSLFPQLIAGPIVRYSDVAEQLAVRTHSIDKCAEGIRRFVLGLSKKVLIANALGELCAVYNSSDDKSVVFSWIYAISYSLQIYFDFSGYSDMAIGLGKIFGFDFCENFNYPYISKSITEFWRRWHMSLGSWFRDYVYIPLGGNRGSKIKHIRNIVIVWFLTGFWHGASWNFIVWGLYFAVFLMIEKFFILKKLEKCRVLSHIYVPFVVVISFVIFGAVDLKDAVSCIGAMFGFSGLPLFSQEQSYYTLSFITILIIAVIGATPLPKKIVTALSSKKHGAVAVNIAEPVVLILLLAVCVSYLVDGSFNPFLYFRF